MKVELAKSLYHGKEGYNCAQAIFKTFQDEFGVSDEKIKLASINGSGRASGGVCGAFYAALELVGKEDVMRHRITESFVELGGSVKCKDIRRNKMLACRDCVAVAARNIVKWCQRCGE